MCSNCMGKFEKHIIDILNKMEVLNDDRCNGK